MKIKPYLFTLLASCLLSILISPLRGGLLSINELSNIQVSSLITFFIYYIFTFVIILKRKKANRLYIFFTILIGASLLQIPSRIIDFKSTISTLLDFLISLIGIISGYATFKIERKRILFAAILSLGGICLSTIGNNLWVNILDYNTFTGKVYDNTSYNINFQNIEGDTLNIKSLNRRFILVECWFTHCRECYKEMPKTQSLYDKYKNNPSVNIFTLHCRIEKDKEDYTTGKSILIKRGYDLPVLSININDSILKKLKLKVFPTTFIFDNHQLIFRGNIKFAEKYLDSVITTE